MYTRSHDDSGRARRAVDDRPGLILKERRPEPTARERGGVERAYGAVTAGRQQNVWLFAGGKRAQRVTSVAYVLRYAQRAKPRCPACRSATLAPSSQGTPLAAHRSVLRTVATRRYRPIEQRKICCTRARAVLRGVHGCARRAERVRERTARVNGRVLAQFPRAATQLMYSHRKVTISW